MKLPTEIPQGILTSLGQALQRVMEVFLKKFERKHAVDERDKLIAELQARIKELEQNDEQAN